MPGEIETIAAERHDWFKASRYALLPNPLPISWHQSSRLECRSRHTAPRFSMISTAAARSWPPVITVRAAASHAVRWPAGRSSIAIAAGSTMRHRVSRKEHPPAADRTSSTNANAPSMARDKFSGSRPRSTAPGRVQALGRCIFQSHRLFGRRQRRPQAFTVSIEDAKIESVIGSGTILAIWAPCDVRSGC